MKNTYSYVDALNEVLSTATLTDQCREKLTALRDQTAKRNATKSDKPTKTQVLNAQLGEIVLTVLADAGKPLTISEMMAVDPTLGTLSNQKVSAVARGLGDKVVRVPDKRVTRFALAG